MKTTYCTYTETEESSSTHKIFGRGPWASVVALYDSEEHARDAYVRPGKQKSEEAWKQANRTAQTNHRYGRCESNIGIGDRALIGRDVIRLGGDIFTSGAVKV